MNDQYVEFLESLKHKIFYICPYQGNSGDALIVAGTHILLNRLQIKTTLIPQKANVILYPGGSPVLWSELLDIWQDTWKRYPDKDFIVGPATFQFSPYDWAGLVRDKGQTVRALFARDPVSYENLKKVFAGLKVQIGLTHDAAFYLRNSEYICELQEACTEEYSLFSFRQDHEGGPDSYLIKLLQKFLGIRLGNLFNSIYRHRQWQKKVRMAKMQALSDLPYLLCDASSLNFDMFIQRIQRAKHIHTDRLHVMILASLLEKPVFAYETAYQKLEAVYQHSMKDWSDVQLVKMNN